MDQTFHKHLYCVRCRAKHCMFVICIFQALKVGQGILYMLGCKWMLYSRALVEESADTSSVTASFRVAFPF